MQPPKRTPPAPLATMPRTRYQGSKWGVCDWIWSCVCDLRFETVLDAFGGTGSVSHMFKRQGKAVTFNDILRFNHQVGLALIENDNCRLSDGVITTLMQVPPGAGHGGFITETFDGIYYTAEENRWLDAVCANICTLRPAPLRALAWYALGQAALAKRPYNLFHRRNLYMRTADVRRGFGNKTTWDRPFEQLFRRFAAQANMAVFSNGRRCRAMLGPAESVAPGHDLVYIDPPYMSGRGVGVDYREFYHFLDGLVDYPSWSTEVDWSSTHRRMIPRPSPWTRRKEIGPAFQTLFRRFADSHLVVSYRGDGIPSPAELAAWLAEFKHRVRVLEYPGRKKYALSTNGRAREVLIVGTND